jgi:hypothetical protein
MDKINKINKFDVMPYIGVMILRFVSVFVSVYVATNIMSQVYIENVLVNDLDPPPLSQLIWTFAFINIIFLVAIYGMLALLRSIIDVSNYTFAISIIEHLLMLGFALIILLSIASTMYSKKFFLYKDDGLRAIRALAQMSKFIVGLIFFIPMGLAVKGSGVLDNMFV